MAEVNDWNIAAASNNDAPPDGWPENMAYSNVNNSAREGMAVIARFWRDINGSLAAAGAANAYTLTLNAAYTAYFDGMTFSCSIPADNTGASTLNVNGLGVQSIVNADGGAINAGQLQQNGIYRFVYDGTNFHIVGAGAYGSMAQQDASAVAITGGTITGITDLAIADGGTGSSTAAAARTALGLAIGSDVQAYDAHLDDLAAVAPPTGTDQFIVSTGAGVYALESGATVRTSLGLGSLATLNTINDSNWSGTDLAIANGGTGSSTASGARTALGLGSIATQAASAVAITGGSITGITDLAVADGGTGSSTAAAARTALGVAIGSDVQAYDAGLAAIAGLAVTNSNFIVGNGSTWVAESGATARTSLGLGTGDSPQFTAVNIGSTDSTLSRAAAGDLEVEGRPILAHADGALARGRITVSTSAPSGGSNGDIWLEY